MPVKKKMKKMSEYRPSIILANTVRLLNSRYNEMVGGNYVAGMEEHVRYYEVNDQGEQVSV